MSTGLLMWVCVGGEGCLEERLMIVKKDYVEEKVFEMYSAIR